MSAMGLVYLDGGPGTGFGYGVEMPMGCEGISIYRAVVENTECWIIQREGICWPITLEEWQAAWDAKPKTEPLILGGEEHTLAGVFGRLLMVTDEDGARLYRHNGTCWRRVPPLLPDIQRIGGKKGEA